MNIFTELNKRGLLLSLMPIALLLVWFPVITDEVFAGDKDQYPNISGHALFELRYDRILSKDGKNIPTNGARLDIEPDFSLNLSNNWSVKTSWRIWQNNKRYSDQINPERYRTILSSDRGFNIDDESLIVEQLKGQFQNDDLRFFFGKFNPAFGTAWRKEKRIGVFLVDFTRDYQLREKIGLGGSVLLEGGEINVSTFFNDTTGLSDSAINRRDREKSSDGLAGNTSSLSSYSVSFEGQDLFGVEDLFYNFGYRNLGVDKIPNRQNESGMVAGFEYLVPIGINTSLIPLVEVAKFSNFSGERDRDALYVTTALVGKYSNWTASLSKVVRDFKQKNSFGDCRDYQMQYSVGYKFDNQIAIDFSRADIKENRKQATIFGALVSYVYKF